MTRRPRRPVRAVVPPVVGRRSAGGVWLNLLVSGFAVLAATWVVHQTEYLVEYGRDASSVLATTPHRYYMAPLGLALAGSAIGLLTLLVLVLQLLQTRLAQHADRLPPRVAGLLTAPRPALTLPQILLTAAVLSGSQMAAYLLQENLESLAAFGTLPGLAVLFAPPHLTVIPLHLLAGLLASFLLWNISALVRHGRQAVQRAAALARLLSHEDGGGAPLLPARIELPGRRPHTGPLGLRAPPA